MKNTVKQKFRHLDLFSGIGGFSLAASWVWGDQHEIHSFVEIEPFAQKVLKKHWPNVPIHEDVTTYEHDGSRINLITGGFPCQDLSSAGNQKGIEAERSGLWSEYKRIIRQVRPGFAIMENVTNLLAGEQGTWFGKFLRDLAQIGYDAEWLCLQAAMFGAPHYRDRTFIVAYPNSQAVNITMELGRTITLQQWCKKVWCEDWEQLELVTEYVAPSKWRTKGKDNTRPLLVRDPDGVSDGVDRLKGCGNAIVPQVVVPIMEVIKNIGDKNDNQLRPMENIVTV